MDELEKWLTPLGLAALAPTLRANDIDLDILPALSETDLEVLGLSLGHRRKLLRAAASIARLSSSSSSTMPSADQAIIQSISASAERRQLTVMFCDLVGSTALSARFDPEDTREIIGAYHRCGAEQITKAGGFVAKYMGDGILAYFGYPEAHEDDADRAVRAALGLIEAVPRLRTAQEVALQVRIGIATGLVVVGDLIGEGAAQEQGVVGDTPNVAARLQSLAEPCQIVISNSTRRLIGSMFEYRDLGRVELKGLADPVQAWRVTGASEVQSRFEAQHETSLTPLVGREEELELLLRRWQRAKAGEGRVVLLSGEPGIGKSRLTVALQERLQFEPHSRLRYFCSPHHQDSAFHPTIAQLKRAAGFDRDDTPETRVGKLETLLASNPHSDEDVVLLAELLSLPNDRRHPSLDLTPKRKKERTFATLLRQLEELARKQPVLMIFEDAHWADPTSRELLDLTVERVRRLPVLLLVTFRPEFQPPWTGQAQVTFQVLSRLDARESATLVRRVAADPALPHEIIDEIVDRADGVPLFAEELTKAVLEAAASGAALASIASTPVGVPVTLHTSLIARLDRLGPAAKEIAQIGAAIGREFSYDLLKAVALRPDAELQPPLDQLVDAKLVFRRGTAPDAVFLFKHTLVQDATYGTLLRAPRRELHGRIARALEEQFPDRAEIEPELLAHHFAEAAQAQRAVGYYLGAGRRAAARSADQEAVRHLTRGLRLLHDLPPSPERDRQELEFQLALGTPLVAVHGYTSPEVGAASERASALCERLGDVGQLFTSLQGQIAQCNASGRTRASLRLAERCRTLAERESDPVFRMMAHRAMGAPLMQLGEFAVARAELEQVVALYDPVRDRWLATRYVTDPCATACEYLTLILWILGYAQQAAAAQARAHRHAIELNHIYTTCHVRVFAGAEFEQLRDNVADTRMHAEAVIALAEQHGFPTWRSFGNIFKAWALARGERAEEGIAMIRECITDFEVSGIAWHLSHFLGFFAEIQAERGDVQAALRTIGEAHKKVHQAEEYLWQAELYRIEGELRHAADAPAVESEACLNEALAVARRQGAKAFELRASTSLARLWRDRGKRTEARDLLTPIYGWFTEGFDTPDLKATKALLEELA